MNLDGFIAEKVACAVESLYGAKASEGSIQPSPTRKEFEGDVTVVTFPLLRISRKSPEATAEEIGAYLKENLPQIESYNVVKGFLNLKISPAYWCDVFSGIAAAEDYGQAAPTGRTVMVEFSSPNTTSLCISATSATTFWAGRYPACWRLPETRSSRSIWSMTAASTSASLCSPGKSAETGLPPLPAA